MSETVTDYEIYKTQRFVGKTLFCAKAGRILRKMAGKYCVA